MSSLHNRILIWGDPHFKRNNHAEMERIGRFLEDLVIAHKPDLLVCLGDVMDTHERCYIGPFNQAHDIFTRLSALVKVVTLVGNHDRPDNTDFMSPNHFLRGLPGLVVDHAQIDAHDSRIMYVPYVPPGRFAEAISGVWHPGVQVCFAHQEFRGAADSHHVSDIAETADPRMLIISGHYHKFQVLGNLIYAGTVQHRFGDCPDNAFMLFDMTANTYTRIPIECIQKKIVVEYDITETDQVEQFLRDNPGYDVRVNLKIPYGHPVDLKDPVMRRINALAKSVVFHREARDDVTAATGQIDLPSYREIFAATLSPDELKVARDGGLGC